MNLKLRFHSYSIKDGLAQASVFCILQDNHKGFIWLGTEQGINRFDGYSFKVYKFEADNPYTLNNNFIHSSVEDSEGIIWLGTNGGGLNRFDPKTERVTHYLIDQKNMDSFNNIVTSVFIDKSGQMWIGTSGGGLKRFDKHSGTFAHIPLEKGTGRSLSHNIIYSIYEDSRGTLWVGTDGGLKFLEDGYLKISSLKFQCVCAHSNCSPKVLSLYEDREGCIWVGCNNGVCKLNRDTGEFINYTIPSPPQYATAGNTVNVIYEDRFGAFWLGTDYGLQLLDRKSGTFQAFLNDRNDPYSICGNSIEAIYEDRSGAMWVGSKAGGLSKLYRTSQSFTRYYSNPQKPTPSSDDSIFGLSEDKNGILWIGTYADGLNAFNRRTGEVTNYRYEPSNPYSINCDKIWSVYHDRQDFLWIGFDGSGFDRLDKTTGQFTHYIHDVENPESLGNNMVSAFLEDRKGRFWVATNAGLDKLNRESGRFSHYKHIPGKENTLVHSNVYVILESRTGLLWLGTKGGISVLNPETDQFTSFAPDLQSVEEIISQPIFSLCEDRLGNIWIGSTAGLVCFNPQNKNLRTYNEKDGLPNEVINGILEDNQGYLWFSTNKGLSKFNPKTEKFQNYSEADGLQSYEFNGGAYYKSQKGELFFGGINGFNAFFPEQISDNPYVPPVAITDFQVFNERVHVGKEVKGHVILDKTISHSEKITLTPIHYIFSFEFSALNYVHSENNEYMYRMEGLEKDWNYAGKRRFVTYTNLSPGKYIFKVRASNNNGVWNDKGVSLHLTILPPFWHTWWFRIAFLVIFSLLILTYHKIRKTVILRRKHELEDMVARRTTALRESGEKYRTVVETTNHGIAIVQDDYVVFLNARFAEMLGLPEKNITDHPFMEFVLTEKQAQLKQVLEQLINDDQAIGSAETVLLHSNGLQVPVEIHFNIIRYRKGLANLMFFNDIGMKKLLEEERMKIAKLETTRVLSRGIAHDYNNLLAIIHGNIDLALDEAVPGTHLHQMLVSAQKAAMRSVDLTRKFITLARGGDPVKKKEHLQTYIKGIVMILLENPAISLDLQIQEDLWAVDCDISYIEQAVKNVVVNAIQAMTNQKNARLEVKGENCQLGPGQISDICEGCYVCITIRDNGHGIGKEDFPRIFDPYFSTRQDVTQKGLGLGLSVALSIISKHDGTIQVESNTEGTDKGTIVRIYLPASQ